MIKVSDPETTFVATPPEMVQLGSVVQPEVSSNPPFVTNSLPKLGVITFLLLDMAPPVQAREGVVWESGPVVSDELIAPSARVKVSYARGVGSQVVVGIRMLSAVKDIL